jgi:hypothetical protein
VESLNMMPVDVAARRMGEASEVRLVGATLPDVDRTTILANYHFDRMPPQAGVQSPLSVKTAVVSDVQEEAFAANYLNTRLAGGEVRSDGSAEVLTPDGSLVRAWPDGRTVEVRIGDDKLRQDARSVADSVGAVDGSRLAELRSQVSERLASLPLVFSSEIVAGGDAVEVSLRGSPSPVAACVDTPRPVCAAGGSFRSVRPTGIETSLVVNGAWFVVAAERNTRPIIGLPAPSSDEVKPLDGSGAASSSDGWEIAVAPVNSSVDEVLIAPREVSGVSEAQHAKITLRMLRPAGSA